VTEDMKIVQEEIFGPVCSISKFKTKEEVIRVGNSTTYGLAAAVHTKNLNTAIEVSNALKAGTGESRRPSRCLDSLLTSPQSGSTHSMSKTTTHLINGESY